MKTKLGIDGFEYLVFDDPQESHDIAEVLSISIYCFGGPYNAIRKSEYEAALL